MTAKELIQGFQKIAKSQLNEFLQGWLGDMKKYFGISLVLLCIFGNAESFNQYFKKLSNKKISSDSEYFKKSNIFQCENTCKKTTGCKIFNFNSKKHLCQLIDQNIDGNYENATEVDSWEVYIKTDEVSWSKNCLQMTVKFKQVFLRQY